MALIKCPECAKEISSLSKHCIYCGFPLDSIDCSVVRYSRTGEVVLEVEHTTKQAAEEYINTEQQRPSYKNSIGSRYEVVPFHQYPRNVSLSDRAVIHMYRTRGRKDTCWSQWIVRIEDERLTQTEATWYINKINYERQTGLPAQIKAETQCETHLFMINMSELPKYQSMSPLRCNTAPRSSSTIQQSQPHCPHCGSTQIAKISTTKRAFGVAMLGLASSNIGKTMECKKCGYKW